ncbi:MAG: hypothetical protein A2107_13080 [Verrucomicrobia bacterium GWF2_62_7]|nr:MAG: hypothetical protein A2107_13080 [Verrucomicrobia bacterium GWF2_62_7]
MKTKLLVVVLGAALAGLPGANAQQKIIQRIYTEVDVTDDGGLEGKVDVPLTHALAMSREFVDKEGTYSYERCFRGALSDGDKAFKFEHLPVGKYDLVLINQELSVVYEGLSLGEELSKLTPVSKQNLEKIVGKQDGFFSRCFIMRAGIQTVEKDGDKTQKISALVERLRDKKFLTQGGDVVKATRNGKEAMAFVRRFEVLELNQASDDWQVADTRHIYRETESSEGALPHFKNIYVATLGNIRVVHSVKSLGLVPLPKP